MDAIGAPWQLIDCEECETPTIAATLCERADGARVCPSCALGVMQDEGDGVRNFERECAAQEAETRS